MLVTLAHRTIMVHAEGSTYISDQGLQIGSGVNPERVL